MMFLGAGGSLGGGAISATGIGAALGIPAAAAAVGLFTAGAVNVVGGFGELGQALSTGSGSGVNGPPAANPGKVHKHHLLPQQFETWFKSKGINIHKYSVRLPSDKHLKGVHGKGGEGFPGQWNPRWKEFIDNNPNATQDQIFKYMNELREGFGISDLPIEPYR
jgi:hypothetical protein